MKSMLALAALALLPVATPPSTTTSVRWDYSGDYVETVIFGELWDLNGAPMASVFGLTWESEVALSTLDLTSWNISTSYYQPGAVPESAAVWVGTLIEGVFYDLPLRYSPQDPAAVPYFRTCWTDINGLMHTVTTPLAGTSQSAIDRAWATHQKLVALMQTVYPPAPPPAGGG